MKAPDWLTRLSVRAWRPAGFSRWDHSIRTSTTLWYVVILGLLLVSFGFILYAVVSSSLDNEMQKTLALEVQNTDSALYAFWRADQAARLGGTGNWRDSPPVSLFEAVHTGEFEDIVRQWAEKTGALQDPRLVRILNRGGVPVVESFRFSALGVPPLTELATGVSSQSKDFYDSFSSANARYRMITHPVVEDGRLVYIAQAVASLEAADISRRELLFGLILVIPWTFLTASGVGWFLASRALGPVDRMIRQVQLINTERLDRRIDVPHTGDELERLAVTFNHLLDRIQRVLKRLKQFSAAASHELRTPLTVMKGELELALNRPRDIDEYRRIIQTHLETVDDLTHIVRELLALARSEAVEEILTVTPVALEDLVKKTHRGWSEIAASHQIRFTVQTREPLTIQADHSLLERLLANLLDNAFKHTPRGGKIAVELARSNGEARLCVRDTGPGIPEKELPDLFDHFFSRRHNADNGESTGLGLGLCRWIAEAHHGRIEVSNAPDRGAVFTVFLPMHPLSAASGPRMNSL